MKLLLHPLRASVRVAGAGLAHLYVESSDTRQTHPQANLDKSCAKLRKVYRKRSKS